MKKIRTFIWDLDETVWFHLKNQGHILATFLEVKEKEKFKQQYSQMWKSFLPNFEEKKVTYDEVAQYMEEKIPILKSVHCSGDDFLQVMKARKEKLEEVNPETIEILEYLKEKGYHNISITDWFASHQEKVLADLKVLPYIEKVYGCDEGYMKSSQYKVKQVTEELELAKKREEFIMVGDSLSSDILFANALGIKSIWYNRRELPNTTCYRPTLEVNSLLKLKTIF